MNPCVRATAIALFVALLPGAADAKRVYQYRDEKGVLHFTDKKPPDGTSGVTEARVSVDARPIVEMVATDIQNGRQLTFRNNLAGPAEIEVRFKQENNILAEPPVPLRQVLAPQRETAVLVARPADPAQSWGFEVEYRAIPGDPAKEPEKNFVYQLPFALGTRFELHQGFGGSQSHTDLPSWYAIDLAVEEGTEVLAAREGTVMHVDRDFFGSGLDKEKFGQRANQVRILHADGSMAVYAHLMHESTVVSPGQRVRVGQPIAKSGNTGFSSGPHLHFVVQYNAGMDLQSLPFRMGGVVIPPGRPPPKPTPPPVPVTVPTPVPVLETAPATDAPPPG